MKKNSGRAFVLALGAAVSACSGVSTDRGDETVSAASSALQTSLSIVLPVGQTPQSVLISATNQLRVFDRVSLGDGSAVETVSSTGSAQTQLGSLTQMRGNLLTTATASLASQAHVTGYLQTAAANITTQAGVLIDGGLRKSSPFQSLPVNWTVDFPSTNSGPVLLATDAQRTLAPGAYGAVSTQARSTLKLSSGTYFFESFNSEPTSKIQVDRSAGPVIIYVRSAFTYKGPFLNAGGLPGELLVVYLGTSTAFVEAPFLGTLVAPSALIDLRRPNDNTFHRGSFFGKSVDVQSDSVIKHLAFSWNFLTADSDCDGMLDYLEQSYGLNPNDPSDKKSDLDDDGVDNWDELRAGGNPRSADTDGDGLKDDPDLLSGRDFDGDGRPYQSDNCPNDANPTQTDRDTDGVGDACDATPLGGALQFSQATMQVTRNPVSGQYAVIDATSELSSRRTSDQKGQIPSGVTFRLIRDTFSGGQTINEYYNSTTRAHAYAVTPAEDSTLIASGFKSLGPIGNASVAAFGFGQSVSLRRFAKGSGATLEHALTTDPTQATALVAAGFTESSALGFALADSGHVRRPKTVVRYRATSGATLHSVSREGDLPLTDLTSEGLAFRVLPEKNGWMLPLVRLRNTAGAEVLSSDSTELSALQSQGFKADGVLGYIFPNAQGDTLESLVSLVRLKKGALYAESVDAAEIQALKAAGYLDDRVLGRVIRVPAAATTGAQCKGQKPPLVGVTDRVSSSSPPESKNIAVLYALNAACTIQRVAAGNTSNPTEIMVGKLLARDPEERRQQIERSKKILSSTAAERAAALGPLAALDPKDCSAPVDYQGTGDAVKIVVKGFQPSGVNGGIQGFPPVSLARLRAPQCQGGVTYDPTLPATPGAADRAITADPNQLVDDGQPETPHQSLVGEIKPRLYGVTRIPPNSPIGKVNEYADAHPFVEMPLIGMDVGPCSAACTASAGEQCVQNRCRAYPVVPKGSTVSFTGSNLWDVRTGAIRIKEFGGNGLLVGDISADLNILPPQGEDPALRCKPDAVTYDAGISPPPPPLPPGSCPPAPLPCLNEDSYEQKPTEKWLERAQITVNVDSGKFYQVQAVNHNGSYFRIGDQVAVTPDQVASMGRTVHVCTPPACTPSPDPVVSACTQGLLPTCSATAGGIWNTPPRPLAHCNLIDPLGTNNACPETPREFVSDATVDGVPLLMFVAPPEQTKFIQTRLIGLQCFDETGATDWGDDELVIHAASNPVLSANPAATADDAIADLDSAFGTFTTDINTGDTRTNEIVLASTATRMFEPTEQPVLLEWGEDDDVSWAQVGIASAIGALAAAGTALTGGAALAIVGAGAAAGGGSFATLAATALPDPDDFLGRAAYQCNVAEVLNRGQQSHSGTNMSVTPLPLIDGNAEVDSLEASNHPAVDLKVFGSNSDMANQSCLSTSNCTSGRVCTLGACVPANFGDRSLPLQFDQTQDFAGTIERRDYHGSNSHYRGYVSTSISGKDIKKSP